MMYVIGSGPSGVACASALLEQGAKVTMLDAGLELEPAHQQVIERLQQRPPFQWREQDLNFLRQNTTAGPTGIPKKYAYGSDFPYRDPADVVPMSAVGVAARPSFAKGGFSNVWGSSILPYRAQDLKDWPISVSDLKAHYAAALRMTNLAGQRDDLEDLFPLYTDSPQSMKLSTQAESFLADLTTNREALRQQFIRFGRSRLAVRAQNADGSEACTYCGMCMYGCPYELFYNSAHSLAGLLRSPNFQYVGGLAVERFEESGTTVRIHARRLANGNSLQFQAERIFLACGVLPTAKIVLTSLDAFEVPRQLLDCQYFLLPLLRYKWTPGTSEEKLHTLSQVFLEVIDPALCDETIHLQLYTYNELYQLSIARMLGPVRRPLRSLLDRLIGRLLLIQGYLPSSVSPSISVALVRHNSGSVLQLTPLSNPKAKAALNGLLRKLSGNRRLLQAVTLKNMIRVGQPGRGFHSGGTFPMRTNPASLETDRRGTLSGLRRVHLVDASVFPSIPSTTITLTIMANAHRIACDALQS